MEVEIEWAEPFAAPPPVVRVFVVEGWGVVRAAVQQVLRATPGLAVAGSAADLGAALRALDALRATGGVDVVVTTLHLRDGGALDVAREVKARGLARRVVLLLRELDDADVAGLLALGLDGYVLEAESGAALAATIRQVAGDEMALSPAVARGLLTRLRTGHPPPPQQLTAREHEVLRLLAAGLSSKEVAARLGLSAKTVERRRGEVLRKLGADSIAAAVATAYRWGLVSGRGLATDD
ncbi:MAG TPA: response regulator transcription factor [Thermomicrobiales bacterium]|nr:response regulator transcription factor [Thermomicrobiales bacterium]